MTTYQPHSQDGSDLNAMDDLIKACNAKANREMMQFVAMKSVDGLEPAARHYVWARQMVMAIPSQMISYFWTKNIFPKVEGVQYGPVNLLTVGLLPPAPAPLPELAQPFLPPPPR